MSATDFSTGFCDVCTCRVRIERRGVNNILHLIMSIITAGVWLIIWLLNHVVRQPWRCVQCGSKSVWVGEWGIKRAEKEYDTLEQEMAE